MTKPEIEPLWKYQDIADWLDVDVRTVREKTVHRRGFPKPIYPVGHPRWHREQIMKWAEAQTEPTT
jgi:hypothetical protein